MLVLDHLAVCSTELARGVDQVQKQLGVQMQPGGKHLRYGTHNMLLGLEDGLYLEVISPDPGAAPFDGPRWFGLDTFTGPPRLANWICRTGDMAAALAGVSDKVGTPRQLSRNGLHWQITVPDDGSLPYGGAFPTLIQWAEGTRHPASRLSQSGCRLFSLDIVHPDAERLQDMIDLHDSRVRFSKGALAFEAIFQTPHGEKVLT